MLITKPKEPEKRKHSKGTVSSCFLGNSGAKGEPRGLIGEETVNSGAIPTEKEAKLGIVVLPKVRYCKIHPEVPQRLDSLGRYMGLCQKCLVERGRKAGENISIPLNLPRYKELKDWLIVQADLNERTLQKEIMMILKTAWRQGT
jgi:hypothetical protein